MTISPTLSHLYADIATASALLGRSETDLTRWVRNARLRGDFDVRSHIVRKHEFFDVRALRRWHDRLTRECCLAPPGMAA